MHTRKSKWRGRMFRCSSPAGGEIRSVLAACVVLGRGADQGLDRGLGCSCYLVQVARANIRNIWPECWLSDGKQCRRGKVCAL